MIFSEWTSRLAAAAVLAVAAMTSVAAHDDDDSVRVMNQNLYEGTNYIELATAGSPPPSLPP